MATQIKIRRDSSTQWDNNNPTLANGEIAYDITNNKIKVGDGTSNWTSLAYLTDATGGGSPTVYEYNASVSGTSVTLDYNNGETQIINMDQGGDYSFNDPVNMPDNGVMNITIRRSADAIFGGGGTISANVIQNNNGSLNLENGMGASSGLSASNVDFYTGTITKDGSANRFLVGLQNGYPATAI